MVSEIGLMPMVSKYDAYVRELMKRHYSEPEGFVGRLLLYSIWHGGKRYGAIAAGSATKFLPGRNEFFGIGIKELNQVVNNTFFHIEKLAGSYPMRNFTSAVVREWQKLVASEWERVYGDTVIGFETLVEVPRTGELYKRLGWEDVGTTKGYTCKRTAGKGTDSWSGKRVWDTENLRPKRVLCCRWTNAFGEPSHGQIDSGPGPGMLLPDRGDT